MPRRNAAARRALVEERRSQILTATAQVFAAKGFERSTIADVARHARVAEGSIYNYFKNKSDLLISLLRQIVQIPLLDRLGTSGAPEETLTLLARTLLATVRRNAPLFRILLSALPSLNKQTREQYLEQVVLHILGILEGYFRDQIREGVFRSDEKPEILARAFVGMFFPFFLLNEILMLESRPEAETDEIIASNVRTFLHGVMNEAPIARPERQRERA